MSALLPIIDISYFVTNYQSQQNVTDAFLQDEKIKEISESLSSALNEWGFFYLKGYGISQDVIDSWFSRIGQFFEQPLNKKMAVEQNPIKSKNDIYGYIPFNREKAPGSSDTPDLKEAFNYLPGITEDMVSKLPNDFNNAMIEMSKECYKLSKSLLRLINMIIGVEDRYFLDKAHKDMCVAGKSLNTLRALYYPPIKASVEISADQMRLSEHADHGTISMLFQDQCGGLEIMSPSGEFVHIEPLHDTILVNACDLLQRWTSDKIKSVRHRVSIRSSKPRQSIVYFTIPDNNFVVSCLDGSNRYEPTTALEYIDMKLNEIYQ